MNSRKKPEILKPYKTLYRGRRLWAVKNNPDSPLDNWTTENQIVVWDALADAISAVADFTDDGSISGCITWGQGVYFEAKDIKEMIAKVVWLEKEYV